MYEAEKLEFFFTLFGQSKKDLTLQQNFLLYKDKAYKRSDIQTR